VGQLSDPFKQQQAEDLGFTFSGLPGERDEHDPEPETTEGGGDGDDGGEVVYELDDRSDMERQALTDRLREATIPHRWDGPDLHIAAEDEPAVENILDILEGQANPPLDPDRDKVAYDLSEWNDDQVERVEDELEAAGIDFEWDGDELFAYADDEETVDDLLAAAADPDELAAEDGAADGAGDGIDGAELLGDLFVAADRLQHDAQDNEGTLKLLESGKIVEDAAPPYGFDPREWERIQERVSGLVDLLIEDNLDQAEVRSQAGDLRQALRPFV
jgi:hypothetical protein